MAEREIATRRRPLLSRDFIGANRRETVARAVAVCAHRSGLRAQTTSAIVRQAGIGRNTFYELFGSRAACLEFACELSRTRLTEPLLAAAKGDGSRRERAARVIDALIAAAGAEPLLVELCLVHSPSGDIPDPHRFTLEVVDATWQALGGTLRDELAANAIVTLLTMQIARGGVAQLPDLRDGLIALAAD